MMFPANELEIALQQAFEKQIPVEAFVARLLADVVWVPLTQQPDGTQTMPTVTMDRHSLLPVFTSEEQLHIGAPNVPRVCSPVRELIDLIPAHVGLAINIGGDVGLPIYAPSLRQVDHGRTNLPAGTRIRIGEPADEPADVLDRLTATLPAVAAVREARRCWAQVGDDSPGLVIGLDLDPDQPQIRQLALDTVRDIAAATGNRIDVVFSADRSQFTDWMNINAAPFYIAGLR